MSVFYSIGKRVSNLAERAAAKVNQTLDTFVTKFKYYAYPQASEVVSIEQFAEHMEAHNSKYDKGDYLACLSQSAKCVREMLLEGKKICLGDLGNFSLSLYSKAADYYDEFSASNITDVKVRWDAPALFKNLIHEAKFAKVETLKDQAEFTKTIRESYPTRPEGEKPGNESGNQGGTTGGNSQGGSQQTGGQQTGGNGQQGGGTVTPPAGGDDNSLGD